MHSVVLVRKYTGANNSPGLMGLMTSKFVQVWKGAIIPIEASESRIKIVSDFQFMWSINHNLFDTHAYLLCYIGEQWNAPQKLKGVRIMDHTLWWSDVERWIKGIQGDQVTKHQKIASVTSHSPPWNASIAMLILSTNEDSLPSPF